MIERFTRFIESESEATGLALWPLLFTAVAIHLWVTLLAGDPWHPDEHFQILEFAWARAGLASPDLLPWEWDAHIRPTFQPAIALVLLQLLRGVGVESPFVWVTLLRVFSVFAAFAALLLVFARVSPKLSRSGRQVLWLTGLLLWFTPLFLGRFSSENWGGMTLVIALTLVPTRDSSPTRDAAAGLLFGLSFLFRYQMAVPAAAVVLWLVLQMDGRGYEAGWRRAVRIVGAALVVVGAGTVLDRWFYGMWVFAPAEYLRVNLIDGVANQYGTSPWWQYPVWSSLALLPPIGVPLTLLFFLGAVKNPKSPWSWAALSYLVVHSLLAHKESRFLLPLIYLSPVLIAWGVEALPRRRWIRGLGQVLLVLNTTLLVLPSIPATHRHKWPVDLYYERALWDHAEEHPQETIYLLRRTPELPVSVYKHPRVVWVDHEPGAPLPSRVPSSVPPEALLLLTFGNERPEIAGAEIGELLYAAESGWRIMARRAGIEGQWWVHFLDDWDDWTGPSRTRRLWQVRLPPMAGSD